MDKLRRSPHRAGRRGAAGRAARLDDARRRLGRVADRRLRRAAHRHRQPARRDRDLPRGAPRRRAEGARARRAHAARRRSARLSDGAAGADDPDAAGRAGSRATWAIRARPGSRSSAAFDRVAQADNGPAVLVTLVRRARAHALRRRAADAASDRAGRHRRRARRRCACASSSPTPPRRRRSRARGRGSCSAIARRPRCSGCRARSTASRSTLTMRSVELTGRVPEAQMRLGLNWVRALTAARRARRSTPARRRSNLRRVTHAIDPATIEAITFDCYGTLDRLGGGRARVRGADPRAPSQRDVTPEAWVARWEHIQFQMLRPVSPLPRDPAAQLRRDHAALRASRRSSTPAPGWRARSPSGSRSPTRGARCAGWRAATASRSCPTSIAICSPTRSASIQAPFSCLVTAEDARAYKPDPQAARARHRAARGSRPSAILHAAFGWKYDLAPARALGMRTCFVNRGGVTDRRAARSAKCRRSTRSPTRSAPDRGHRLASRLRCLRRAEDCPCAFPC